MESNIVFINIFLEIAHWTGYKSRLDRYKVNAEFVSPEYAKEELVVELANSFLCTEFGIENKQIQKLI